MDSYASAYPFFRFKKWTGTKASVYFFRLWRVHVHFHELSRTIPGGDPHRTPTQGSVCGSGLSRRRGASRHQGLSPQTQTRHHRAPAARHPAPQRHRAGDRAHEKRRQATTQLAQGADGDVFNALLCGAGNNLRIILRKLRLFFAVITAWRASLHLTSASSTAPARLFQDFIASDRSHPSLRLE